MPRSIRNVIEELGGIKQINNQVRKVYDYVGTDAGTYTESLNLQPVVLGDTKVNAIMVALHSNVNLPKLHFGDGNEENKGNISASYRNAGGNTDTFQSSVEVDEYIHLTEDLFGMSTKPNFSASSATDEFHTNYFIIPVGSLKLESGDTLQVNFNALKFTMKTDEKTALNRVVASISYIEFGTSELTDYLYKIEKVNGETVGLSNVIQLDILKTKNYIMQESDFVKITTDGNSFQFYGDDSSVLCQAMSNIDESVKSLAYVDSICRFDKPINATVNVNISSGNYKALFSVSIKDI